MMTITGTAGITASNLHPEFNKLKNTKAYMVNKTFKGANMCKKTGLAGALLGLAGCIIGFISKDFNFAAISGCLGAAASGSSDQSAKIDKNLKPAYEEIYARAKSIYKK